jgi:hypothetical protein
MNDSQLIEQLANTDLYRNDVALPETMRPDIGLLEIARRIDMDTMERVEVVKPPRRRRNGPLIAAAAFAVVIVVGLAGALLASNGGDTEPGDAATTEASPITVAPEPIDIGAADPIQATNDQASRVTVKFAGNARALAQGAAHVFEIEVHLEGSNELNPGATVTYLNRDGVITTTGSSPGGAEMTATWDWFAEDALLVTLRGQGIGIPDTRPEVVVSVQETASSEVAEFVMDSPAP